MTASLYQTENRLRGRVPDRAGRPPAGGCADQARVLPFGRQAPLVPVTMPVTWRRRECDVSWAN